MGFAEFLVLQLIAHILYDFFFQNDFWVRHRRRYKYRSRPLYWHVIIVFFVSWIFSFQLAFFVCSFLIALSHFLLDGMKAKISKIRIGRIKIFSKGFFFIDQIIHLIVIVLFVNAFDNIWGIDPIVNFPFKPEYFVMMLAYLVCLKPSNIFIREFFNMYNFKIFNQPGEDLLNAGKIIGNIERILTLTLLIFEQFEAVGFIIAGKSILRYEGVKTSKTEYVLIGTLLSFGIAIIISILLSKFQI
jgi:hypothetical protein